MKITEAIGILRTVFKDRFTLTLSDKDFNRLYLELQSTQRYPGKNESGFKMPHMMVHNSLIKNRKYHKGIQDELRDMIDYLVE